MISPSQAPAQPPVGADFDYKEQHYRLSVPNARTQLHIMRRIAPFQAAAAVSGGYLPHILRVAASMPQEDVDYILDNTLACVSRRTGDSWMPVFNLGARRLQFEDLDGADLYALAHASIKTFEGPFQQMLVDELKRQVDSASTMASQASS